MIILFETAYVCLLLVSTRATVWFLLRIINGHVAYTYISQNAIMYVFVHEVIYNHIATYYIIICLSVAR